MPGSVLCAECKGELAPQLKAPGGERTEGASTKLLRRPLIGISLEAQAHQLPEHLVPPKRSETAPGKKKRVAHNRLPRKQVQCPCGVVFDVPVGGHRPNIRYHSDECKRKYYTPPGRQQKWVFTEETDAKIRAVYQASAGMSRAHPVRDLADELGIPRWKITRRAIALGLVMKRKREPAWTQAEIRILKEHAHRSPYTIQRHLKASGFKRSTTAIVIRRKRSGGETLARGYSACEAGKLFGIDGHCITKWIQDGIIPAERRGSARTHQQGGDIWFITPEALRLFVMRNVELIDFRKLDKFWLVELLTQVGNPTQSRRSTDTLLHSS